MTIERIHQEIKFRWNKLNSNHKKDFPKAYLDDAINKASNDYIDIFYSGNNTKQYKLGFEVTQQRIDLLQTLVVPELTYSATPVTSERYQVDLTSFDPSYRHFLRAYVNPVECPDKRIPIDIIRLNDLDKKLSDHHTRPSLPWNRCLGSIKGNYLELYTKGYTITEVHIEYLKNPIPVFSGGYDSLEYLSGDLTAYQAGSPQVQSEIPNHDLLVDMTVQYISSVLEDANKFQLQEKTILNKV